MSPVALGLVGLCVMLVLLFARLPVGIVMFMVGIAGFGVLTNVAATFEMVSTTAYGTAADYGLTVIPMFVLMGEIAFRAGVSRDLYKASHTWFGHVSGGLAMASVVACAGFAALCGSSVAGAATMSTVAIPEMKKYGYAPSLRTAVIAAGGTLGILIPPSVGFVLYGTLTNVSISQMFIAGILPGIFLAIVFCGVVYLHVKMRPSLAPGTFERTSLRSKVSSLGLVADTAIIFALVMGGLFAGIFTPTESGAMGAFLTLVLALIRRRIDLQKIVEALKGTAVITGMVFLITMGAMVFSRFLALSGVPTAAAEWIGDMAVDRYLVLVLILVLYLILGALLDTLAMILLTIPIFFPIVTAMGFDEIWFGVVVVIMAEVGLITPPVGMNAFVIAGANPDVELGDIFRGVWPFVGAMIFVVAVLVAFPGIATVLPGLMR